MEVKKLTCIECPKSCALEVDVETGLVKEVRGNQCPRGRDYAVSEIENTARVLTSTVRTRGLALKMIPVRSDKPVPKTRIRQAAAEIKKIVIDKPVCAGEIIVADFLGLGVNIIATRGSR